MIAILADVHGNYPALRAVLTDLERRGCDRIVSLGDVAGYYCLVNECIDALRDRQVPHLMGNHDHYLVAGTRCPRSRSANACLDYQRAAVTPERMRFLAAAPLTLQWGELSMVHGGWRNPLDEYLTAPDAAYFAGLPGRFFFSGHTHVQVLTPVGEKWYCNPGSVGQPRDGDPRAGYAVFADGAVELVRVAYDVDEIAVAMRRAGFAEPFFRNLYTGTRIGGGVSRIGRGIPS